VVLCSIFFILGMLVGRAHAEKLASNGPTGGSAKNAFFQPSRNNPLSASIEPEG
jgi:hypothetical protein